MTEVSIDLATLTETQRGAIEKAQAWFPEDNQDKFKNQPIFVVSGYAGTGKSYTVNALLQELNLNARIAVYTGKGALVLVKQGIPATTIHKLIYRYEPPSTEKCEELYKKMQDCKDEDERRGIKAELEEANAPRFSLNLGSDLLEADVLVLDECSMVNDDIKRDILTFGIPVIALGDPGQLPPIKGTGALFENQPDVLLTEIMRQAEGNPIIKASYRARNMIPIPLTPTDPSLAVRHFKRDQLKEKDMLNADQVLCGKNVTRTALNQNMRQYLGRSGIYPVVGDKLICLRNDPEKGLFNGLLCTVEGVGDLFDFTIALKVRTEIQGPDSDPIDVRALRAYFDQYHDRNALDNVKWWARKGNQEFDFGYAITVHKAQGSQWENVLLIDDGMLVWDRKNRARWLYTAVTRPSEKLTIVSK